MTSTITKTLNLEHIAILEQGGIDAAFANQAQVHSINRKEDLAPSQQYLWPCKGMVFTHLNPFDKHDEESEVHDDDGNVVGRENYNEDGYRLVRQVRFDDGAIPEGLQKYMQEPGTGAIPSVHPSRVGLIGKSKTLHLCEGTKGSMSAARYNPADVATLGILGITGTGDKVLGMAPWFTEALIGVDHLIVTPDADVKTSYNVWQAVSKMTEYAKNLGVKKVTIGIVQGGGKDSYDDVMGKVNDIQQRFMLAQNHLLLSKPLSSVKRTSPRKPKVLTAGDAMVSKAPKVDWDDAEVRLPDRVMELPAGGSTLIKGDVLMEAGARISKMRVVRSNLNNVNDQAVEFDLEFKMKDGTTHTLHRKTPTDMGNWRTLLDSLPGGVGYDADFLEDERGANQKVSRAVRTFKSNNPDHEVETINVLTHAGLTTTESGDTAFLLHEDAICEFGNVEGLEGDLSASGIAKNMETVDLTRMTDEQVREAVHEYFTSLNQVHDRTALWALKGALYFTPTGLRPQTGLGLVGAPGSGKSTEMQFEFSGYGRPFMDDAMFSFDGSENRVGAGTGIGFNNLAVCCDDLRFDKDFRVYTARVGSFELLMRRSYGGGASGKGRQKWSASKGVTNDEADGSNILVVVGAEPKGFPAAVDKYSTVERMLVIEVVSETSLVEGGEAALRDLSRRQVPMTTFNSYLRWLSAKVDDAGGLAKWNEVMEKKRDLLAAKLTKDGLVGTKRSIRVSSVFILGIQMLLQFASDIGALSDEEVVAYLDDATVLLTAAARAHFEDRLADARTGFESTIEALRQARADERAWIHDNGNLAEMMRGNSVLMGRRANVDHPVTGKSFKAVVLNPDAVAKVLRMTKEQVQADLRERAVPNKQGRYGWERNAGAGTIKNAIVLRADDFFLGEDR
jgi:hypothetical protein